MALDVNGYNDTFKAFADFARISENAGEKKAVARFTTGADITTGALAGRNVVAASSDSVRGIFKWFRASDDQKANNETRKIFREAIIDMFGGESKIPESVKKAMVLADYDKGKPLTARRILIVKAAIDADCTTKANARTTSISRETFQSEAVREAALKDGFSYMELPKLARTAHLYAQVKGVDEMTAMKAVSEPNTPVNRLMQYGNRFLGDVESFKNGLRLLDSFKEWFTAMHDTKKADGNTFANAKSFTDLNFKGEYAAKDCIAAFERFVFEELAVNEHLDLNETDPEKLFGMKNNAAMRFFGTGRSNTFAGVMASIPPERRSAVFAVFDKLTLPLPQTQEKAKAYYAIRSFERGVHNENLMIGRILRHLPEIEKFIATGTLTEKNIAKTLYPDMQPRNWTLKGINNFSRNREDLCKEALELRGLNEDDAAVGAWQVQTTMEETCCTLEEAVTAYTTGVRIAPPKYMTTATFSLEKLDGTTRSARDLLDGNKMGDLWRPYNYAPADDPTNKEKFFVKSGEEAFGFKFPDGTELKANPNVHSGNIPKIIDKLEGLAGKVHPRQQSALMFAVSQAGTGVLKGGLMAYGIKSSEHAAVNFELRKDDMTGAITVKYTSPESLPVRFSWSATIDVDGNVSTTPMVVERHFDKLDAKGAASMVDGAAERMGVKLDDAKRSEAARHLETYCTNMNEKNAKLFANFVVNLANYEADEKRKEAMLRETADSVREWRDFDFADKGKEEIENAAKDLANFDIRDYMQPSKAGKFKDNIHQTMTADANRAIYVLNGKTFNHSSADELIPAFKEIVPGPVKQKAISSWLHQLGMNTFISPSNHVAYETGVEVHKLPGFGMIANRNLATGTFYNMLVDTLGKPIVHDLQVSPDGRFATITQTVTADLASPGSNMSVKISFGQVTFSQRLVLDLTTDIPSVVDFKLSQKFG